MASLIRLFSCLLLLGLTHCQPPLPTYQLQPQAGFEATALDLIYAQGQHFPPGTQLALAWVKADEVAYYGVAVEETALVPADHQRSLFEIASITKVFTATLLSQAAISGQIDLDEPIATYLPFELYQGQAISSRQLANHTSGLPALSPELAREALLHPDNPYQAYHQAKLVRHLRDRMRLNPTPGEVYRYSNLGYGTLGYVLESALGQSYASLLQEQILDPLGMTRTYASWRQASESLIPGFNRYGEPTAKFDMAALAPAGSMVSSVEDLVRFVQWQFEADEALQLAQTPTFSLSPTEGVALGWHLRQRPSSGPTFLWHNGGTVGASACLAIDLSRQHAVVLLSNLSAFHPERSRIDELCFQLLSHR